MMECTNPGLFSAGPVWLDPGEQRRHEALWQLARGKAEGEGGVLRRHVDECSGCAQMVHSFRLLSNAVWEGAEVFTVCPSARDLSDYLSFELPAHRREGVDEHLRACSYCRDDLGWLNRTSEPKIAAAVIRRWLTYGLLAASAGLALMALIPMLSRPNRSASPYADLARIPVINRGNLIATLHQPQRFRSALEDSLNAYDAGDYRMAAAKALAILQTSPGDPSALFIASMSEYQQGNPEEAEKLMDESERSQPMSGFRCWSALQLGLATGSRVRIDRECQHLENSPDYAEQVRLIREAVRRRGA